jgi:hypothetical protein
LYAYGWDWQWHHVHFPSYPKILSINHLF